MKTINGKRAWLIADIHLGVRNNSPRWISIHRDYFFNFFIPLLKRERQPGDVLFILGDVFDSRNAIGLTTLNLAIEVFEALGEVMPVYIILGNHDLFNKTTTDINSLKAIKWIPNIHVFEEPELVYMAGRTLFMMPWRKDHATEMQTARMNPADFLFCHADIAGMAFNRYEKIKDGISTTALREFKQVYSGHIHHAQTFANVRMLGCPYPMTKNDIDNEKGVWLLDVATGTETYFENDHSPRFVRLSFDQALEMSRGDLRQKITGNFVDLIYDPKWMSHPHLFTILTDELTEAGTLFQMYGEAEQIDLSADLEGFEGIEAFDLNQLADDWADETPYDETITNWLKKTFRDLHKTTLRKEITEDLT